MRQLPQIERGEAGGMSETTDLVDGAETARQGGGAGLRPLLIATSNPHKLEEFRALLMGAPYRLVSLRDAALAAEIEETSATFAENAVLKAVGYARATGLLTLADDSGLEIDALGGEPGVYSARWAGPDVTYAERFRIILARLADVPEERRTARYRCAIAIAGPGAVGLRGVVEGVLEGRIANAPRGTGGFGYDPLFYVPALGRTVGELSAAEKHAISHRARAAAAARDLLGSWDREPAPTQSEDMPATGAGR
jgi:XTP/dITP diphosphohydrolase